MNTGTGADVLRAEVACCRAAWRKHWHQRHHPDIAMRESGVSERRFWAASVVRARQMLRTELRIGRAS
jgi:hypothetical protein